MKFIVKRQKENILNLVRALGYVLKSGIGGEFNCVRTVGGMAYPRFHLFIKEDKDGFVLNLHLDQKRPSYSGSSAHSGEYEGKVVEQEAERIKKIVEGFN